MWLAAVGSRNGLLPLLADRALAPDHLAARLGLDAGAVARWCRGAHAVGLLSRRGGAYRVPRALVPRIGRPDDPASLARQFEYLAAKSATFDRLDGMLRGAWPKPDLADVYAVATRWDHVAFFDLVLPREDATRRLLQEGARVLDLGAGDGTWAVLAKARFPRSRFAAAETAAALPRLRKALRGSGIAALRLDELPEGAFDVAYLGEVLGAARTPAAPLRTAHRALAPGGRLHAMEGLLPPEGREPRGWGERLILAMDFDFGLDGSRFLAVDEARAALREAGFARARLRDVGGALYHVAATKPKR